MKTTFGEYIRLLRNDKELTLTQLAAKLNLDSANLSKIENGKRDFDEKRLPKLAKNIRAKSQRITQRICYRPNRKTDIRNKLHKTAFASCRGKKRNTAEL